MSSIIIARGIDLTFLVTSRDIGQKNNSRLPIILKKDSKFDWEANSFLTKYGGGSQTYNTRPKADTVIKKAYSLNIFCSFIEEFDISINEINDSSLYLYIKYIKNRMVEDDTILSHGRTALEYIVHLNKLYPELNLATSKTDHNNIFNLHYTIKKYKNSRIQVEYLYHDSFKGLIHISSEPEYVRDYELFMWIDAIKCSDFHPNINEFLVSRWEALTTLLEITGSRISEVHEITRTMIKDASELLFIDGKKPFLRNIPIRKGKYKGKTRTVPVTHEDIQVILIHVDLIEKMFPKMEHDAIFVDSRTGRQLKPSYLKNYAKKVINGSKYHDQLRHLSNHSFRHRFITLHIAKALNKLSKSGSFANILSVASNACRKVTMHASNSTLSHYVHFANDINNDDQLDEALNDFSVQVRIRIKKMISTATLLRSNSLNESEAIESFLATLDDLKKIGSN